MKSTTDNHELEKKIESLSSQLATLEEKLQISKQLAAEKGRKLERLQKLTEAVIEQSPISMALVSADAKLMAINKTSMEQLGNPDIKIGMPMSEMKHMWQHFDTDGNSIPFEKLPIAQSLKGKVTMNKEIHVIRQDGSERWESASSSPIYDKDGNIMAAFLTFPDITERKKAEVKLLDSETRYRNLFENAGTSIWNEDLSAVLQGLEQLRSEGITDLRTYLLEHKKIAWDLVSKVKVLQVNEATLRLFDAVSEEVFLNKISDSFGASALDVFIEELCAIWDKKPFFTSNASFITTSGKEIKAIISFKIPDNAEEFNSIPVSIQDITKLEYQEDRINAIVDALPDIAFILDEDGRYVEILTSRHELLFDELQSLKGNLIHDMLPEDNANFFIETIRKTLKSGKKQVVEYEIDIPHEKIWFEGRVSPMQNTFNQKRAVVWIAVDITEHKQIETQFRQAQKMEAIGILTGGIAHEFNNLLSPILGYTELFLNNKTPDDPDYKGHKQILIAGNRAKILVQQLLAYGRQSMSRRESVQLEKIVEEALSLIANTVPSNISIRKNIQLDLPSIHGMPNEIHQIILNLCVNASHAMPSGGELSISLKQQKPPKKLALKGAMNKTGFILLTIQDTGAGMDNPTLERIFDPFFTTKDIGQGSGLGLSVVQGIVEQHGGVIDVESRMGQGTSFHIYFPIAEHEIEETTNQVATVPLLTGNERIMLVDDEQMILDISKNMLEMLDYEVSDFLDCEQALKQFTEHPKSYDLVIVDYGMPIMNGKQFSEKLKQIRADIPIVLCTGYGDLIAKENIQQWGMDDILIKPFAFKEISDVIRTVLSNPSSG